MMQTGRAQRDDGTDSERSQQLEEEKRRRALKDRVLPMPLPRSEQSHPSQQEQLQSFKGWTFSLHAIPSPGQVDHSHQHVLRPQPACLRTFGISLGCTGATGNQEKGRTARPLYVSDPLPGNRTDLSDPSIAHTLNGTLLSSLHFTVGYQAVAYNHEITGKIPNNHVTCVRGTTLPRTHRKDVIQQR